MNETTADNARQGWVKSLTRITSYMSVCLCPRVRGFLIVLQGDQPVEIALLILNVEYENVGMILIFPAIPDMLLEVSQLGNILSSQLLSFLDTVKSKQS